MSAWGAPAFCDLCAGGLTAILSMHSDLRATPGGWLLMRLRPPLRRELQLEPAGSVVVKKVAWAASHFNPAIRRLVPAFMANSLHLSGSNRRHPNRAACARGETVPWRKDPRSSTRDRSSNRMTCGWRAQARGIGFAGGHRENGQGMRLGAVKRGGSAMTGGSVVRVWAGEVKRGPRARGRGWANAAGSVRRPRAQPLH